MSSEITDKIKSAIAAVVPSAQAYTIYASPTGFDDSEVVRVITTAWQKLGKAERIAKVQNAVMTKLAPDEQKRIFRFSVLTPKEWEGVRLHFVDEKPRRLGYRSPRVTAPK
jgi:hypothetical protein